MSDFSPWVCCFKTNVYIDLCSIIKQKGKKTLLWSWKWAWGISFIQPLKLHQIHKISFCSTRCYIMLQFPGWNLKAVFKAFWLNCFDQTFPSPHCISIQSSLLNGSLLREHMGAKVTDQPPKSLSNPTEILYRA